MTIRQNILAILNYEDYDKMPIVHFGFWGETLQKWADQGHISHELANKGNQAYHEVGVKLGFDFEWSGGFGGNLLLDPAFERKVLKEYPDGRMEIRDSEGVIVMEKKNTTTIPTEIDHLLKDRESWERDFKHRLQFSEDRFKNILVTAKDGKQLRFDQGGAELLPDLEDEEFPRAINCGSMIGKMRNMLGVEGLSYLYADDEELFDEIVDTIGNTAYLTVKGILEAGVTFDYGAYWEDICFKNGPLVVPSVFDEKCGPWYKKISEVLAEHGTKFSSVDCDGKIDSLIPTWINNGVNIMFPIEVGTWEASIEPWRQQYGKKIRGVGGMKKSVFAQDQQAIDSEIERLKKLFDLGGYIPCPDHRIAPDAEWDNVQYYCESLRKTFG